jgi:hypothetical protein
MMVCWNRVLLELVLDSCSDCRGERRSTEGLGSLGATTVGTSSYSQEALLVGWLAGWLAGPVDQAVLQVVTRI